MGATAHMHFGVPLDEARVICVLIHGRGQTPEAMQASVIRHLATTGVACVLRRALQGAWYAARAVDALTKDSRAELAASLAVLRWVIAPVQVPGVPLVLGGFSQGAYLALELAFADGSWPGALVTLTGCRVGQAGDAWPRCNLQGLPVYLTGGDADAWIPVQAFAEAVGGDVSRTGASRIRCGNRCAGYPAGRPCRRQGRGVGGMMRDFTFSGLTTRVVFGSGTIAQVGAAVARLGHARALVLSMPHQRPEAKALAASLGALSAGLFAGAVMQTPVDVTDAALAAYAASGAVVALGGGSTIGLGKAIVLRTGADEVVILTTFAGSEMTDILGRTVEGRKTTQRDAKVRPEGVIYDVDLTMTLPVAMTMTSGLNAIAHAMEALYAPDRNPIVELMCKDSLVAFKQGLPVLRRDSPHRDARAQALHHSLAPVIGGNFNVPHADTHAILLPHTAAFNAAAVPELLAPSRRSLAAHRVRVYGISPRKSAHPHGWPILA